MEDDSYYPPVRVAGAPGYGDFKGVLILRAPAIDGRGDLAIVGTVNDGIRDVHVISMKYVTLTGED